MTGQIQFARLRLPLISFLLALGFFILSFSWGLSSPPGSSPDEDFHAASIVCASGDSEFCEVLGRNYELQPIRANVPERIESSCFFTAFPSKDASCIYDQLGEIKQTSRINVSANSSLFYSVMNKFLGIDYESSIRAMRTFNAALFSTLLLIALLTVAPQVRRGVVLMLMTAMVPFALFFVPSINLSSWNITGIVFSWIFLYSLISMIGQPRQLVRDSTLSLGLIVSVIMALGSRRDSAIYLLVGALAVVLVMWPKANSTLKWLTGLTAGLFVTLAFVFQSGKLGGFTEIVSSNLAAPGKLIELTVELPSVIAGIIGSSAPVFNNSTFFYYGLGWHEVQMPASVILITLATLGGLVFALIPGAPRRVIVAVSFVVIMMIAIQMYAVASYSFSGEFIATPRYMTPLFLVAVVIFFSLTRIRSDFPSRSQALWIFLAMPAASAIALLTTIRRYTNGQSETWFELFFQPKWWWEDFPIGPTGVWFLGLGGSLMLAYAGLLILREQPSVELQPKVGFESSLEFLDQEQSTVTPTPNSNSEPATEKSPAPIRFGFILSWLFSLISAWSLLRLPGELNPAANLFRGYFPTDQLSYAGIAASAKAGNFGLVEPFTQTGFSFYPSWWYKIIGQFASYTRMEVPAAWSFLGFLVVLGSVAFIGLAAYRISRRAWAPLVIGVLLWVGPLSSVLFDNWFVNLDSHAVLWGPYGALYPLNGEAAGLSIGAAALALGYWTLHSPEWSSRKRHVLLGLAGLGLGVIANFQTYSFLTLTAVTFWILAVAGLLRSKSRNLLFVTISMLVLVLLIGPSIRGAVGALAIYALMLVPTLPGLWLFAKKRFLLVLVGLLAFTLGAAPQVLWMISGTLAQDPFLTYRVDQSGELGVPLWAFVLLGSPILATWAAVLWAQILRKGTAEIALLVGWFVAFVLLSFNGLWGFGQEPYRFWINSVIVFVVIATLTIPTAVTRRSISHTRGRVLIALAVVLIGASVWNVGGFREYLSSEGNIDFESPRFRAIDDLVNLETMDPGLLTSEPCVDPRALKVITGAPVAFYNLGLAWPENKTEIDALLDATNAGVLDVELMRAAGVSYLITDTSCPTVWYPGGNLGVAQLSSVEYPTDQGNERVELWRIL